MSAEEQLAAMDDEAFDAIADEREQTLTPQQYADAQHTARRGGHFAPRDASLIARALLYADAEIALLRKQRDAYSARMTELEQSGEEFLRAYLDASVNDEEGLLSALDAREWTAMWVSVDDKAQAFGDCLSSSNDRSDSKVWGPERMRHDPL